MPDQSNINLISNLIKKEIESYENKIETSDVGSVVSIGDGIATIYGLDKAMYGELLLFKHGVYGMVMNLEEDSIGAVILGKDTEIYEGDEVKRTGKVVSVPVGDALLGRVVNALGQPIDGLIYCAIGQKNSTIAQIVDRLKSFDALKYTVIVNASASESAPMLYVAPYAATTIAEYWEKKGKNVLIVYDDLSKHAVSYRALSLLLKRSPGREAYPGDIFYLHSRLLERACHLSKELGGGSITALPIVETQAGDISAYIPTNVISITDGQIFLKTDLFNVGQRPAIDSGLSVSRVGSAAQIKAMKSVASSIKIELASYAELLDFSRFGSDLDQVTKNVLRHGAVLMEVLKQKQYSPIPMEDEIVDIYIAQDKLIDDIPLDKIHETLVNISLYIHNHLPEVYDSIRDSKILSDETKEKIKTAVENVRTGMQQ